MLDSGVFDCVIIVTCDVGQ